VADNSRHTDQIVAEFKSSGLLFDQAMAQTHMAVCITDPRVDDNPIVYANAAFLKLTGYRLCEVLGQNCRMLQGAGTNRVHTKLVRESVVAHKAILVELLNYRKDGTPFWNALHVAPIFDEDGKLIYYFGSQLDISDVHAAREAAHHRLSSDDVSHRLKSVARRLGAFMPSGRKTEPGQHSLADSHIESLEGAYSPDNPIPTADLGEIIRNVMRVYDVRGAGCVSADGPTVYVPEDRVGMVGLCLHELATHAMQQGAWSQDGGHISIQWSCPTDGHVEINWHEHGGQSEAQDINRGLGLPLLKTLMEGIGGELSHTSGVAGAHMRLSLPIYAKAQLEVA